MIERKPGQGYVVQGYAERSERVEQKVEAIVVAVWLSRREQGGARGSEGIQRG